MAAGAGSATVAVLAILAEQTLSAAVSSGAGAWVLREGELIASAVSAATDTRQGSFATALRPGDVIALSANADAWFENALSAAVMHDGVPPTELQTQLWLNEGAAADAIQSTLWFRCEDAKSSEVWSPLTDTSPHPSWVKTVFNEYGTHIKS